MEIPAERMERYNRMPLSKGSHRAYDDAACAMEMVSYLAGELWSDHPQCACPTITAFVIAWNDVLSDEDRNRLIKPFVPRLIGTRSTFAVEEARSYLALDWYLRVMTPAFLDLVDSLKPQAEILRAAAPVVDVETAGKIGPLVRVASDEASAARSAAWSAAESAAWSAAESAAWSAARSAARSAAWSAARSAAESAAWSAAWSAAESAAESAAWSAAESAAWSAAESAAESALKPTVDKLQASAIDLLERMLAL